MCRSTSRIAAVCGLAYLVSAAGCTMVPKSQLTQCQTLNRQLHGKNQSMLAEVDNLKQHNRALADQARDAGDKLAAADELAGSLKERVANFEQERDQLRGQYASLVNQAKGQVAPLPPGLRGRLEQFARSYPDAFEFDPETGVSKFRSDVLFQTGSADIRPEAERFLREFAQIFNATGAQSLNIHIVGHTDNQPIAKAGTKAKHPSNWHLSVHRAIAVESYLAKSGIVASRMGVAGYGEHQPLSPNSTADSRQRNRRVEIYVLSPDAAIAAAGRNDVARRF